MQIEKLILKNFKCFENHTVHFNETTIIVGKNNAGKTTVIEALRIIGVACDRLKNMLTFVIRPDWLVNVIPLGVKGVKISATNTLDIDLDSVFSRYGDPPAIIKAYFSEDVYVEVYIKSPEELFAVAYKNSNNLHSKAKIRDANFPEVRVLPQIVPLLKDEERVSLDTLKRNRYSKRTSRNFRSNLYEHKNEPVFGCFEELIEKTWNGMQIQSLSANGKELMLYLRDRDFVIEIYHMGHGVQMWLQTMWFIACSKKESIIILDEPDVYMHADLQRKLIRMLNGNYNQTVIATHSIEIISEVEPSNILIIDRSETESIFADEYPIVQAAISGMGSVHNISLARILNNKKYLYVEGNDMLLLKIWYDQLFQHDTEPLDHIASTDTGGWGSWEIERNNIKRMMSEKNDLKIYVLYDRDYYPDAVIDERIQDAKACNISLHVLAKKEIENYLLVPTAIARYIKKKNKQVPKDIAQQIEKMINELCETAKEETFDKRIDHAKRLPKYKHYEYSSVKQSLMPEFNKKWSMFEERVSLIPGKETFCHLSDLCKTKYNVSFGCQQIASSMNIHEIAPELRDFLSAIRQGSKLY